MVRKTSKKTTRRVVRRKAPAKRVVRRTKKATTKRVTKRVTKKATSKRKMVKVFTYQTGVRKSIKADKRRKALPAGRRISANGNPYTETRKNRSDKKGSML